MKSKKQNVNHDYIDITNLSDNFTADDVQQIMATSNILSEYSHLSERNTAPKPPDKPDLFIMLRDIANSYDESGLKSIAPIYDLLLKLNNTLPKEKLMDLQRNLAAMLIC